ncbi:hypothetical protein H4Q26_012495 [Puccinia striiformis f. sp. tritici PST-130]|nr:hypothetical protein H4Q26_012495 [Puccinia striiformis f. sp. tritici PST-130]
MSGPGRLRKLEEFKGSANAECSSILMRLERVRHTCSMGSGSLVSKCMNGRQWGKLRKIHIRVRKFADMRSIAIGRDVLSAHIFAFCSFPSSIAYPRGAAHDSTGIYETMLACDPQSAGVARIL